MSGTTAATSELGMARRRYSWTSAAAATATALTALAPLFAHEIAGAVRVWYASPTYNHCFLVIPIVAYLIWNRRGVFAEIAPRPFPPGLAAVLSFSVLWLFAAKLDVLEARQFAFIAIAESLVLTLIGPAAFRRLLGPLLYLFFLVPSGEYLIPRLQDFSAGFAVAGLHLMGVPVYTDGTFIQIPEGTFVIAVACAGLRFLVASIAYGVLFALVIYKSWRRRLAFIALSLIIPVVANGIRCFGIIYAAHLIGSARAAVADHVLYGWMFFSIVIFLLTAAGMAFTEPPVKPTVSPLPESVLSDDQRPAWPFWALAAATIVLAGLLPARELLAATAPASDRVIASPLSSPGAPWQLAPVVEAPWQPTVVGAQRHSLDVFVDGHDAVERFVAFYLSGGTQNNLVRSLDRIGEHKVWRRANSREVVVRIRDGSYPVEETQLRSNKGSMLIWSFYVVDGRTVASPLEAKLLQAYADLTGRGRTSAFVAVATPMTDGAPPPSNLLARFLANGPFLAECIARTR